MQPVSGTTTGPSPQSAPGKSGMAVGQIAKKTVAAAFAAGIELPRNAQGMAASAIARGADPASLFAAQAAETANDAQTASGEPAATPEGAISAFKFNAPAIQTEALDPADTALRLLSE